jgi:hypothetical protein
MRKSSRIKKSDRSVLKYIIVHLKATLKLSVKRIAVVLAQGKYLLRSVSGEEKNFKHYASDYGLVPHNFGNEFTYRGRTYTICGLSCEDRECPIIAKSEDGKKHKYAVQTIHDAWKQEIPF